METETLKKQKTEAVPKLRFKEFLSSWSSEKLKEVIKIRSGLGFKAKEYSEKGVKLLQIENVTYGQIKWTKNVSYLPASYLKKFPELHLKQGDIVLALNRPVTNDQLKISRISILDEPSILYQRVGKICLINHKVSSEFIYQAFKLKIKKFVLENSIGSDQPFISTTSLYKLKIKFPDLEEQQKIATFLSAVDEKIQQLIRKKELLETYKKGVMQQLFSPEIRFKDKDGKEFPEWKIMRGKDLFFSHSNKDHNGDLEILAATQDQGIISRTALGMQITSSEASIKSYKIVEPGDFVISLRSFQGGIEYSEVLGICSPAYIILKPKTEINNDFFKYYFKKESFIERLSKTVVGIRDGKQISYEAFSGLKLEVPSVKEQQKIAGFLSAIDKKIEAVSQQISQTQSFKKGLLQQMFV